MEITYVPMARGLVYLAAAVDWFSRHVLSWRVSITSRRPFFVEALEEALAHHGKPPMDNPPSCAWRGPWRSPPNVFNADQGSQFTNHDFTGVLLDAGIAISMDGKGSLHDNVFLERLWRSIKYEEVYLKAYNSVGEPHAAIGRYLTF